jgi:predicted DNA-binding transcriptional regulator YafY
MLEKTDDEHGLTVPQLIEELAKEGVTAERKSIYADFADMQEELGIDVIKEQHGKDTFYYVGNRDFELAEVKLLIDAIQASKFITEKKSRELIGKLKRLVSTYQARQLQREVFISDRAKTMNEGVYYNVDAIHAAMNANSKIRFKYYKWDITKKLVQRNKGEWFKVSPLALTWNDENYYLVAYDDWKQEIKHYRVDKMKEITATGEKSEGKEDFKKFDMAAYSKATFGMYNGTRERVNIRFANEMCGVLFDRFGKDITVWPVDDGHSETSVVVSVSPQFFGWIFSLGEGVKVVGPSNVVEELRHYAESFLSAQQF